MLPFLSLTDILSSACHYAGNMTVIPQINSSVSGTTTQRISCHTLEILTESIGIHYAPINVMPHYRSMGGGGLTKEGAQPQLANVAWLQTQQIGMVKVTRRKCIRTSAAPKHLKAANKALPKKTVERPVAY